MATTEELQRRIEGLERIINDLYRGDRYVMNRDMESDKDTGFKIGKTKNEKIGFWGRTPTVQYDSPGDSTGHNGGGGTTVTHTDTFYGGTEFSTGNQYTINDLVKALKRCGILAP